MVVEPSESLDTPGLDQDTGKKTKGEEKSVKTCSRLALQTLPEQERATW